MNAPKESSTAMADINVTPMVDVMLVLQGINLKERPDDPARVEFGIAVAGRYYLNQQLIAREDAPRLLQAEFQLRPQDKVLFLKADRSIAYREVMTVMEIAREAGARVVAAVTDPVPGSRAERQGGAPDPPDPIP